MNRIIIGAITFIIGAGAGFFAGKKVYEGYYANLADEEIGIIKDTYYARLQEVKDTMAADAEKKPKTKNDSDTTKSRSSIVEKTKEREKTSYHLISKKTTAEPPVDEEVGGYTEEDDENCTDADDMTESESEDRGTIDRTEPYIITSEEFNNEFDHHDKISLYYYRNDDVLLDESEPEERNAIIDDIETTVGYAAMSALNDQTHVWVRNEPAATDYEITAINMAYSAVKHGVVTPTRKIPGGSKPLSPREIYEEKQKERDKNAKKGPIS